MSGFDFAVTVAIGSVFAAIITTKNPPLLLGLFTLGILFAVQMLFAWLRSRVPAITTMTDNAPRLIMVGADIQHDQLKAAKMTVSDLKAKLREANVLSLNHVACVIAETTGDVSVLHADHENPDVEMGLLEGVIGAERLKP